MLIRMSWTSLRGITNVEMKYEMKMIKSQPNDIYVCVCANSICTVLGAHMKYNRQQKVYVQCSYT